MPYSPLTPFVGVLLAFMAAFILFIVFSVYGNTVVNELNNTNNLVVNLTQQWNSTARYKYHVSYINYRQYGTTLASIVTQMAPIALVLGIVAYVMYAGKR